MPSAPRQMLTVMTTQNWCRETCSHLDIQKASCTMSRITPFALDVACSSVAARGPASCFGAGEQQSLGGAGELLRLELALLQ